jgi:hypothetical protein
MRNILFPLFWILSSSAHFPEPVRAVFGVRIAVQANSELITFVGFLNNGRTLSRGKILTEREFIYIASGEWPSIYNPERRNYFEEHNLNIGILKDSLTLKETFYCVPCDSLWKIRFSRYPFNTLNEKGWSNELFRPSNLQEKYLYDEFNIGNIDSDYFLDSNFWELLSDVQNNDWVLNYKSIP